MARCQMSDLIDAAALLFSRQPRPHKAYFLTPSGWSAVIAVAFFTLAGIIVLNT